MAKFYEQYRDVLEANGYIVEESGCVRDSMGNQAAAEDAYGNVQCKDPNVTELCRQAEAKPAATKKATKKAASVVDEEMEEVTVRARNEKGHYIKDDPDTPENEAWTTKMVKKVKGTKKA
jgi:hypothetical protein